MLRLLIGIAAGYLLGTRAGRARYEQIIKTTRAVAGSPATRKAIEISRRKLSDTIDPRPKLEPLKPVHEEIVDDTTIYVPRDQLRKPDRRR